MCRLTAYSGVPIPVSRLLFGGSHSLLRQSWAPRELLSGSVNADGWGITWWREGQAIRLARAEPAWFDPDLQHVLESVTSEVAVAALRNATPGLTVDPSSTPPLTFERWSFVLNGFVPRFRERHMRALRTSLPDDLYAELRGASDAETLFLLAVHEVRAGATLGRALRRVSELVCSRTEPEEETQLTMLLSDQDQVVALNTSNVDATNSLYVNHASRLAPDGTWLASEPLTDEPNWERVEPHTIVTLREGELHLGAE